jgi:hypothetical protein
VHIGRAHSHSSDTDESFVSVDFRDFHVRTSDCQTVVKAHLSRFTFSDISGRMDGLEPPATGCETKQEDSCWLRRCGSLAGTGRLRLLSQGKGALEGRILDVTF